MVLQQPKGPELTTAALVYVGAALARLLLTARTRILQQALREPWVYGGLAALLWIGLESPSAPLGKVIGTVGGARLADDRSTSLGVAVSLAAMVVLVLVDC